MAKIERLSDYQAQIGAIVLSAPDRFPRVGVFGVDQAENLKISFEMLWQGFALIERKIKDPVQLEKLRGLLNDSLIAYQQGDYKRGAHLLQDFQDIISPNRFRDYERKKGLASEDGV